MISLILPYWDRQEAADKALALIAQQYAGLDLEVIVVCDGNVPPFRIPDLPITIHRLRLPAKSEPKSPVFCWNEGVKVARGDVIAISCIEVLHDVPVLQEMAEELERQGPDSYVLAAAWCPELKEWHCHSIERSRGAAPIPDGTGRAFMGMMNRELYDRVGGFDEAYRDGAGYEDLDFINKMLRFGVKFVIRDDLVVTHPKAGATINWGAEKFQRNKAIYEYKWVHKQVNFVCLKQGTAFGPEYVNNLLDMVKRNLPLGYPGRFHCVTDNPDGLHPDIVTIPLPDDLEKWWGKLYMFSRGLFPDGSRVCFMDLDTLVVGSLAEIVRYDGQFATLRDFYIPERLGPAVILWEAGDYASSIWEEWVVQGKPRNAMGDLWWLNNLDQGRFARRADKLQELYPGAFCSFKVHCSPMPPAGTKVVCFHGHPRPHEAVQQWVHDIWKVGGGSMADIEIVSNTEHIRTVANVRVNSERAIPWVKFCGEHEREAVIVGGGPSVGANLEMIRYLQNEGAKVFALNGAAKYLKRHGIIADAQVILDGRQQNAAFIVPEVPEHYLCSQCDPSLFDALSGRNVRLYHVNTAATLEAMKGGREANLISTGSTVGLVTMGILYVEGFRQLQLFGFDSSYTTDHHAYEQKLNDEDRVIEATAGGRTFKCAPWMLAQAQQFQEVAAQLANDGCVITVAGDGLLPHIARLMSQPQEIAA